MTELCCACCEGVAKNDHVEFGGFVRKDGHEIPCVTCQNPAAAMPAKAAALANESVFMRASAAAIAAERERVLAEFEALADDLTPPYNCDLNDDGSADREMAAWVEGRHESITDLRALVARLRGQA